MNQQQRATLKVEDVFFLKDGATVILGAFSGGTGWIGPSTTTVRLNGQPVGKLVITGERTVGGVSDLSQRIRTSSLRAVETRDAFSWNREEVTSGNYEIEW
jgi:hypothetical protein